MLVLDTCYSKYTHLSPIFKKNTLLVSSLVYCQYLYIRQHGNRAKIMQTICRRCQEEVQEKNLEKKIF